MTLGICANAGSVRGHMGLPASGTDTFTTDAQLASFISGGHQKMTGLGYAPGSQATCDMEIAWASHLCCLQRIQAKEHLISAGGGVQGIILEKKSDVLLKLSKAYQEEFAGLEIAYEDGGGSAVVTIPSDFKDKTYDSKVTKGKHFQQGVFSSDDDNSGTSTFSRIHTWD